MANVTCWQNEVSDRVLKKSSLLGCRAPRMPPFADKLFWTPRQQRTSPMADAASTRFTTPTTLPATRSTSSCHTEFEFVRRRSRATKPGHKGILPAAHRRSHRPCFKPLGNWPLEGGAAASKVAVRPGALYVPTAIQE